MAVALAAILLRLAFDPLWGTGLPFITLFPAIMLSSWVGGLMPGVVTTTICAAATVYLWLEPARSWSVAEETEWVGLAVFLLVGVFISGLNDAQRRTTAVLTESDARLRAALQAGHMGSWRYTVSSGEVDWSPELEAIHGLVPGTFPRTFDAFQEEIHSADRERVQASISAAIAGDRDHHIEYRILRRDGETRWVEGVGQVFRDEQRRAIRMVGVCADITARKEFEGQRERLLESEQVARAEIVRANRMKDDFLATLGHELRHPLNAIIGYADLLISGVMPQERVTGSLQAIRRAALAQARLVETLLDLSRIEAGKLALEWGPLDLRMVLDAAVEIALPLADAKNISLVISARPSVAAVGDAGRLQQVLWNLLQNAIKFSREGSRVAISLSEPGPHVRIDVSDDGAGIDPEFLPHIFDRFAQGGAGGSSRPGLGLGLALVRELVHAHGGTVDATSPGLGQGSTFTVTLPLPDTVMLPLPAVGAAVANGRGPASRGRVPA